MRRAKRAKWERAVDKIQAVRTRNNVHWMDLVRLAMRVAPKEARRIFREIEKNDRKLLALAAKMSRAK